MSDPRVAVLISGSGSNLQALIDAAEFPSYPAKIALVISNKADAFGLERAKKAGIPTQVISGKDFTTREAYDEALHQVLLDAKIELVCLAGFMRILTPAFVSQWVGRMINIHPSLLPEFAGLHTHQRAIEAGKKEAGCTVHFVTPVMDAGPILAQARVPVLADDTAEILAARVLAYEHKIYPEVLKDLALGKLAALAEKARAQTATEAAAAE